MNPVPELSVTQVPVFEPPSVLPVEPALIVGPERSVCLLLVEPDALSVLFVTVTVWPRNSNAEAVLAPLPVTVIVLPLIVVVPVVFTLIPAALPPVAVMVIVLLLMVLLLLTLMPKAPAPPELVRVRPVMVALVAPLSSWMLLFEVMVAAEVVSVAVLPEALCTVSVPAPIRVWPGRKVLWAVVLKVPTRSTVE